MFNILSGIKIIFFYPTEYYHDIESRQHCTIICYC